MQTKPAARLFRLGLAVTVCSLALPLMAQEASPPGTPQESAEASVYLAARSGRIDELRGLIAGGADIDRANARGRTPLMTAVFFRNYEAIRELLSEGANVNASDNQGRTALMLAVANSDMRTIQWLLDAGVDVTAVDKQQRSAVSMAERGKKKTLVKLLKKYEGG